MSSYKEDILAVTSDQNLPWQMLQGRNIMVTGATGLIGSCLVEILLQKKVEGCNVYAFGRNESRAKERFADYWDRSDFHFVKADVISPLESDITFHYIVHAASNASPNFFVNNPVDVMLSNLQGVQNLMNYGLKHSLERFLFVSSGEVYGEGDGREFTEDYSGKVDSMSPRSCYPSSKRAAETLCASYASQYQVHASVARLSHTYGPYFTESDNRVYAQFIRNVLNEEDIVLKSKGEAFRSWCYVVDSAKALLYVLMKGESGLAYNVADATSNISIRDLAEMVARIANRKVIFQLPDEEAQKQQTFITKAVFNTLRLESLGWSVNGKMADKMAATIEEERLRKSSLHSAK